MRLAELIGEHRPAFEYDWRTRFQLPLSSIGDLEQPTGRAMGWGEAVRLAKILSTDPSSQVFVALAGWRHALSREAAVMLDLFDLTHRANSQKKPSPHPGRPFDLKGDRRRTKATAPRDVVRAALRAAGHG